MGLFELMLGKDNPATKWAADNRGYLTGVSTSLLSDGMNFAPAAQGAAMDREAATKREADAKLAASTNATKQWLAQKYPDLAQAVDAGLPVSEAWQQAFARQNAKVETPKPLEINGQLVDPVTFQVLGDFRTPEQPKAPALPAGYRQTPDGNLSFIPGGPADPSTQAKTTEAQRRNQQLASVISPEVATVEQNWEALTKPGDQVTGGVFSPAYQTARNSLGVIAQSYLYSVSGAAATDAEVAKIVDSVTPRPFDSPQATADKLRRVKQMAQAVIDAGGGVDPAAAPADGGIDDLLTKYGY